MEANRIQNVKLHSVPDWLMGRSDTMSRGAQACQVEAEREYLECRAQGRVPIVMAKHHMTLTRQGVGTFTDEIGVAWYRDGENIIRVTEDLNWIENGAVQGDVPKKRTAQTQIKDNSDNQFADHSMVSSDVDVALPQDVGERLPPTTERKRQRDLQRSIKDRRQTLAGIFGKEIADRAYELVLPIKSTGPMLRKVRVAKKADSAVETLARFMVSHDEKYGSPNAAHSATDLAKTIINSLL